MLRVVIIELSLPCALKISAAILSQEFRLSIERRRVVRSKGRPRPPRKAARSVINGRYKPMDNITSVKEAKKLKNADNWKHLARWNGAGYYELQTEDTGDVPVRIFLTPKLLKETEEIIYRQIVNATRFPGVKIVIITPDTHYGYGVPVGCVILTDGESGAVAMGPVGYDISCGMVSAKADVPVDAATPERRMAFNRAVMERVNMGAGGKSVKLGNLDERELNN